MPIRLRPRHGARNGWRRWASNFAARAFAWHRPDILSRQPNFNCLSPLFQACTSHYIRRRLLRPTKPCLYCLPRAAIGLLWKNCSGTVMRRCGATLRGWLAPISPMTFCRRLPSRFFASSRSCASLPSSTPGYFAHRYYTPETRAELATPGRRSGRNLHSQSWPWRAARRGLSLSTRSRLTGEPGGSASALPARSFTRRNRSDSRHSCRHRQVTAPLRSRGSS